MSHNDIPELDRLLDGPEFQRLLATRYQPEVGQAEAAIVATTIELLKPIIVRLILDAVIYALATFIKGQVKEDDAAKGEGGTWARIMRLVLRQVLRIVKDWDEIDTTQEKEAKKAHPSSANQVQPIGAIIPDAFAGLDLPEGWTATPASSPEIVAIFDNEGHLRRTLSRQAGERRFRSETPVARFPGDA